MHSKKMLLLVFTFYGVFICTTLSFNENQFELLNACINKTLYSEDMSSGDMSSGNMSSGDGPQTGTPPTNECKCPDGRKGTKCTLKVKPKSIAQFTFRKGALRTGRKINVYIVVTAINCEGHSKIRSETANIALRYITYRFPENTKVLDFGENCWITSYAQLFQQIGDNPAASDVPTANTEGIHPGENSWTTVINTETECK